MTAILDGYRSISLLAQLNWDRALYALALILALGAGAYVGTLLQ